MPYIDEAYTAKKYAFVSDYARFDILYQHGGIYFDTDVEVIKPFDAIVERGGFMGIESVGKVAAGLGIGCNAGLGIVYQILDFYASIHFVNADGSYNLHTVVEFVTAILKKNGLKEENSIQQLDGLIVYPIEYFCPMNFETGVINITNHTYCIHHYDGSWLTKRDKRYLHIRSKIFRCFGKNFVSWCMVMFLYFIKYSKDIGFIGTLKYCYNKLIPPPPPPIIYNAWNVDYDIDFRFVLGGHA
jgi:hypothetical protein